ncbi:MAG: 2Fe-2S iron-sulfur cluster-binding protein [Dehalococcoidia bacterium]|jgi:NADH dehydrogenase/NADH:ubiquinone oxidoreductase subunit G
MLGKITLTINEKKIKVLEGATILEAASEHGILIPTLCKLKDQSPTGACRVCIVEVQGSKTLVGSCHTPVSKGMVILTDSPKVVAARKVVVELLLSSHTGDCVNDPNAENCYLHNLASDYEIGAPRFKIADPRFYPIEESNPYVRRDLSKCILCRKCIQACAYIANKRVLSVGYRGSRSKIITGFDEPLKSQECKQCGVCIEHCPTGALSIPANA